MGLAEPPAPSRLRLTAFFRRALVIVLALAIALTAASFGYNLATGGQAARPAGLSMVNAGGHSSGAAVVGWRRCAAAMSRPGRLPRRRRDPAGSAVVDRLAADQSVPDDDAPARAQFFLAHPQALQLPVRAGLPAPEHRGRADVAPPA